MLSETAELSKSSHPISTNPSSTETLELSESSSVSPSVVFTQPSIRSSSIYSDVMSISPTPTLENNTDKIPGHSSRTMSVPTHHASLPSNETELQQHCVVENTPGSSPLPQPGDQPSLWVFGYGSLMWKTDFAYRSKVIGYIKGYERRFYLGNTTFRGHPGQPGRVANLVEVENGQTWGVAFEVYGQEEVTKVLKALYAREVVSGGYVVMTTDFFPRENDLKKTFSSSRSTDSLSSLSDEEDERILERNQQMAPHFKETVSQNDPSDFTDCDLSNVRDESKKPIQVLLFTASEDNDLYLGPDDVDKMAAQIVRAKGSAGSNVEYVTRTADFVRMYIPEDDDSHLFHLDTKVRELVYKAQASDAQRLRLGFSYIVHDMHLIYHDLPQVTVVKGS